MSIYEYTMNVHKTATRQYQAIVNRAASRLSDIQTPTEGWMVTVRKALGMSGAQLARRLGVTRAAVSQTEKHEAHGGVTLRQMQKIAGALGCRFVYAIVPEGDIEDVVRTQAGRKASELVRRASGQMALEEQSLPKEKIRQEVTHLRDGFLRDLPADLWDEK